MPQLLLNTVALDPNRWTAGKEPFFRLETLLEPIVAAGFRALELWQYHLSTLDDSGVEQLAERLEALGVTAPIVGLYPVLDRDGEAGEADGAAAAALVERAARLGAGAVKMFAGRVGSAEADAAAVERSVAATRRLAAVAGEHGLGLTVETHPDTLCDGVGATRRFLDAVADERLAVCFQPFDFESTAQTLADYQALRDRVVHVHLQGRRDDQMSLLEEADVDYAAVLGALADDGFEGALSIEFVKDCVVDDPADFDLGRVLAHAQRDRAFVRSVMSGRGER